MANNQDKGEMGAEVLKNTQELATQAALRAQQMLRRASQGSEAAPPPPQNKAPEVPARGGEVRKAPEVPPKRLSLKKTFTPQEIATGVEANATYQAPVPIPQRNLPQNAPPVPQKPVNSPLMAPKFKDKLPNSPLLNSRPNAGQSPQLPQRLIKPADPTLPSTTTASPQVPLRSANTSITSTTANISASPQLSQRSNVSSSTLSSLTNSPLPNLKPLTSKSSSKTTISPSEELGSEDALRGIESGLRNMERAMQEQMNMRSMEAASQLQRQFNPLEFKNNIRGIGSMDRLQDSGQSNLRIMENLRLNFEASMGMRQMGRNLSMDQMQLESLQNSIRGMGEQLKGMSGSQEYTTGGMNAATTSAGIPPNMGPYQQFRSLDRHLPLELQYSRHRTEIDFLRNMDPRTQEQFLRQRQAFQQQHLQQQQQAQQNQQQNQQGGAQMNRDDLRLRRRSSHDETQYTQQGSAAAVSRLREHWDETSQAVLQRKSQLAAMLGDSQRFEAKRLEIEAWLTRMESRSERMGVVATTADVLEAQQKEQKSFHAELHQYKHQIELFNQLTQKLIAVYPTDDTSRIKRMTEAVNLRYNNLNNAVISRGKMLHAAVHSLQSFDRHLDQFLAWLSEAESLCENTEAEIERNPLGVKVSVVFLV